MLSGTNQVPNSKNLTHKQIMGVPVLKHHQPGEPLTIHCYASEKRLDASLLQEQSSAYADSGLSETEQRYVQTENELLAVVFGMEDSISTTMSTQ